MLLNTNIKAAGGKNKTRDQYMKMGEGCMAAGHRWIRETHFVPCTRAQTRHMRDYIGLYVCQNTNERAAAVNLSISKTIQHCNACLEL